ncbi:MAG: hypothetical protein PHW13_11345 [Methylococcales bacterium]|nr:hypothetical protein [Methylococcales bacterium]
MPVPVRRHCPPGQAHLSRPNRFGEQKPELAQFFAQFIVGINIMQQLFLLFFEITMLRKGPQDVPAASWLLKLLLPVYLAINILVMLLNGYWSTALMQVTVDFLLLLGFTWPLLYFSGKRARFPQTLCALLGADSLISLCAIPAIASLVAEPTELAYFAMLLLMIWHWLVSGHIYRHALDKPLFFGLGLSLLYILISSQVMVLLFPVVSTPS